MTTQSQPAVLQTLQMPATGKEVTKADSFRIAEASYASVSTQEASSEAKNAPSSPASPSTTDEITIKLKNTVENILKKYGFKRELCNEFDGDKDYYLCLDLEEIDEKFYGEALITNCKSECVDDNYKVSLFNGNFYDIETEEDLIHVLRIFCKYKVVKR